MVNVQPIVPTRPTGEIDLDAWVDGLVGQPSNIDKEQIRRLAKVLTEPGLVFGVALADLLLELQMDQASILAGLVYRDVRSKQISEQQLMSVLGAEAVEMVQAVMGMASTSLLEMSNSNLQDSEQESQVENIKHMIVAMIDDPRVAVVKLAERVIAMRRAKNYDRKRRQRVAMEALSVFAPLAGRLGIGQVKWELEDLALRYSEEEAYQAIATQLRSKRVDRERQILMIEDRFRTLLKSQGIEATLNGRAKHIYSIWRKMKSKGVTFEQVYDVRALRIIVENLAGCYAVLGLIHTTWSYLPSEFDDYIANPKENGYQSIHTAVSLEDGQLVEVQIRTANMHAEAELGVCAHWSYKGDSEHQTGEQGFRRKTEWLRQVIEWHAELEGAQRLSTLLQHRASDERIYVSTPQGHVLDLPHFATVLDFAFRVHTDVGHACVDGTVDGIVLPVYHQLRTSQQVAVRTIPDGTPRRDWLEQAFGYARTDRARAKLSSFFRHRSDQFKAQVGRDFLAEPLAILALEPDAAQVLAVCESFGVAHEEALMQRLGGGELSLFEIVEAFIIRSSAVQQLVLPAVVDQSGRQLLRLYIHANNREGLLHDITEVFKSLSLALTETSGRVLPQTAELSTDLSTDLSTEPSTEVRAEINMETSVRDWRQTLMLHTRLRHVPQVIKIGLWAREPNTTTTDSRTREQ